ncbi:unnamed protein product [Gordionus sp. m RMFG-2023]
MLEIGIKGEIRCYKHNHTSIYIDPLQSQITHYTSKDASNYKIGLVSTFSSNIDKTIASRSQTISVEVEKNHR